LGCRNNKYWFEDGGWQKCRPFFCVSPLIVRVLFFLRLWERLIS
jgi:hypothetical protein